MQRFGFVGVAVLCAACGSASAGLMSTHNLVVLGNFSSNSDVEGRSWIGGNFSSPTASNYGTHLTPSSAWLGVDVLSVAGNMTIGNQIQLQAGNLRRGGSRSGNVNFNGGGAEMVDLSLPGQVGGVQGELQSTSTFLRNLAADSALTLPAGQPGPADFNSTPGGDGVAVFSINGDNLFESNLVQQMNLSLGGASSIIINVGGTNIDWSAAGSMVGVWNTLAVRSTTLWNFYEATSINLTRNFNGAILAPLAHLTNNTAIEGSVFVKSMAATGEVHLPNYGGYIPTPGAGSVLMLGGIFTIRRRRAS